MSPLRIAVVGVGHLGRHHARILAELPEVQLVGVVDTNRARAEEVAAATRTRPFFEVRDVIGLIDAATIAVPTEKHRDVAMPCLEAGIPVLVEKPMAKTLDDADAMIDWLTRVFGFTERGRWLDAKGNLRNAELYAGSAEVWIDADPEYWENKGRRPEEWIGV